MAAKKHATKWSDDPTPSFVDDKFGRHKFAKMVATRIGDSDVGCSSTVFGLVGPWGSGKTSLVNVIRSELAEPDWAVVDFSPWSAMDANSLTVEFLKTLTTAFGGEKGADGMRDAILSYSRVALPFLGIAGAAGSAVQGVLTAGLDLFDEKAQPWNLAFEDLATKIADRKQRVLIVVDDVDRLDPAELIALLRVIRLLGRFENVHYLLAYDQETIESILAHQGMTGRTTSFMEKIVQYPFEVPPLAAIDKRRLLNVTIRALLERADESSIRKSAVDTETREQRALTLMSILVGGLSTPRSFARFQEQVNSYANLVSFDEIDVLDFIAVTYLRVFHHSLWAALPGWSAELTARKSLGPVNDDAPNQLASRVASAADGRFAQTAIAMLGFLVEDASTSSRDGFLEHINGFSDPNYFERYFIGQLAGDDVSDVLITQALYEILDEEPSQSRAEELAALIDNAQDQNRAMLAIEKVMSRRKEVSCASEAMLVFAQQRLEAQPPGEAMFDRPRGLLARWVAREMLLAVEVGLLDAQGAIDRFGEKETFGYLYKMSHNSQTRQLVKEQAAKFVDYAVGTIWGHFDEVLKERPRLRTLVDLVVFAGAEKRLPPLFDDLVGDNVDLFGSCVASFGTVNEWVGAGREYEISFNAKLYVMAFGARLRADLAPQLKPERSRDEFPLRELEEYPPEEDVRDFALDSAKQLAYAGNAE